MLRLTGHVTKVLQKDHVLYPREWMRADGNPPMVISMLKPLFACVMQYRKLQQFQIFGCVVVNWMRGKHHASFLFPIWMHPQISESCARNMALLLTLGRGWEKSGTRKMGGWVEAAVRIYLWYLGTYIGTYHRYLSSAFSKARTCHDMYKNSMIE